MGVVGLTCQQLRARGATSFFLSFKNRVAEERCPWEALEELHQRQAPGKGKKWNELRKVASIVLVSRLDAQQGGLETAHGSQGEEEKGWRRQRKRGKERRCA